jgi:transposase
MSRTPEKINQPASTIAYAGIDVGKSNLDFYITPVGKRLQVKNDKSGVQAIARHCLRHDVKLLALEATGKYHRLAHDVLHEAGVAVAVINPFRSRQFADSMGKLAKSDTIDAEILAEFAERMTPQPTLPPSGHHKALRELHTARRQAVDEAGDLKRRLQSTEHPLAAEQIRLRITLVESDKAALEQEIQAIVAADPDMSRKFKILTSIPGIGKITATLLISDLCELGQVNAKQIAALAGVAPMNWDSGNRHGSRIVRGGRRSVRNALYMCAVSCISRSGSSGAFYRRLIQRGKNPKVALTAVMRKLVIAANSLIAEDRVWQCERP